MAEDAGKDLRFYTAIAELRVSPPVPSGTTTTRWQPSWRRIRPPGTAGARWLVWWALHHLRVFATRDYSVMIISDGDGAVVHRTCIFPRWFRFPFMGKRDLQTGDVWTAPERRSEGIASTALQAVLGEPAFAGRRFWYVVAEDNVASCRVAEKAGFEPVGRGRRTKRFGSGLAGSYILEALDKPDPGYRS